ncbi:YjgN family protein [Dyella choica]|nr:YjgN family protein [Dyella choica]
MHNQGNAAHIFLPEIEDTVFEGSHGRLVFEFHGNARDYFRIWIVNVALSIITLGLYSAWASVRTRRYMYANTALGGSRFEYLAEPIPILRGRLLAAAIVALLALAPHVSMRLLAACIGVMGLLMPWFIVKGMLFRARYSAWRGVNFRFDDDYVGAYKWYLVIYAVMAVLALVAMKLLITNGHQIVAALLIMIGVSVFQFMIYPWVRGKQQQWMAEQHYFGGKAFRFRFDPKVYRRIYRRVLGIYILSAIPAAILVFEIQRTLGWTPAELHQHPLTVKALSYLYAGPINLAIWAYIRVRMTNALYNHTSIGPYQLESSLSYGEMLRIYFTNAAAIICTLGLATPWAVIRVARYRAEHLRLEGSGSLDEFVQTSSRRARVSALGSEVDSLLGFDIGL